MTISQNTHLHPAASVKKPPATGPTQGPRSGPSAQTDIALPRFSMGMMSAMLPLPMVIGTAPARPIRNRKASIMPMLLLRAVPTVKTVKRMLPILYIIQRP